MLHIDKPQRQFNKTLSAKHFLDTPNRSFFTDAVLFDLFDTLVLIDDERTSYIQSLWKMHRYLSHNGLEISFSDFKRVYLGVVDKINAETEVTLEEPHFSVYIERTLIELDAKLKGQTHMVLQAVDEFTQEFKQHIKVDPQAIEVLGQLRGRYKTGLIKPLFFRMRLGTSGVFWVNPLFRHHNCERGHKPQKTSS